MMERSLRTLLDGVIDYAGLFPPAKLDLESATEEYLQILDSEDAWLVRRFACNAGRLAKLAEELEKHELSEPVAVTVIGTSGADKHHWDTALALDIKHMAEFDGIAHVRGRLDAYEVRLPDNAHAEVWLDSLEKLNFMDVFVEVPWGGGIDESVSCIAGSEFAYAKARTGGADAASFPTSAQLSKFIQHCVQLDVPFKLTAGLHQPLPHRDANGGLHHGFLNVLVATTLAGAHDLTLKEIEQVLQVQDAREFEFKASGLKWGTFEASLEDIEKGRELFVSLGSCSVAEPLEGLAKARLVKETAGA